MQSETTKMVEDNLVLQDRISKYKGERKVGACRIKKNFKYNLLLIKCFLKNKH